MAVINHNLLSPAGGNAVLVRNIGGFVAVFSVVMGTLVLYVIPSACSFLGGLELLMLAFLFLLGAIAFLAGMVVLKRR